jgi:hypothetical protein
MDSSLAQLQPPSFFQKFNWFERFVLIRYIRILSYLYFAATRACLNIWGARALLAELLRDVDANNQRRGDSMASPTRSLATLLAFAMPRPEHAFHAFHQQIHLRHRRAGRVELQTKSPRPVEPQNIPLDIVYEDADMLAISKPPGMTVQLAQGAVENAVAFHLSATSAARWGTPGVLRSSNHCLLLGTGPLL